MSCHARVSLLVSATRLREAIRWAVPCWVIALATSAATVQASSIHPQSNPIDAKALQPVTRFTRDIASLATNNRPNALSGGDTYGLAATGFGTDFTDGQYVSDDGGVSLTFSGEALHEIAPSSYGNSGDKMFVIEETNKLSDGRVEVMIDVVAVDSGFNLTNWFADGSEAAPGVPFQIASVDIGDFDAPLDALDVGTTAGEYILESAEYFFVGTGNTYFGPGGDPFQWFDTSADKGISGSAWVSLDSDLATTTFSGQEFAGFSIRFALAPTAVPEPTSALLLSPLAMFGSRRRI